MIASTTRRRFLGLTGAGLLAYGLGQWAVERPIDIAAEMFSDVEVESDPDRRVLVVVDLDGGNDPLNTFIPQSGTYHDLRPSIGVDQADQLRWQNMAEGVNPALESLTPLWQAGLISVVWGIGLVGQSRSHFVAQDAWRSGQPGLPWETGWLGRWLDSDPNRAPLRAVSLGTSLDATSNEMLSPDARHTALRTIADQQLVPPYGSRAAVRAFAMLGSGSRESEAQQQASDAILPAVAAANELRLVVNSNSSGLGGAGGVRAMFDLAVELIEQDRGTRIVYLTIPGFDTHAGQPSRQAALLRSVGAGLSQMFGRLALSGHAGRTLAITTSEFGRRVAENRSNGTDHGAGGLSLVVGPAASASVVGEPDLVDLDDGDLAITIDSRSLYRDSLDWLGGSNGVLGGDWPSTGALKNLT